MNTTDRTVAAYLRNVRRQRRITREEEVELGGRSRSGCEGARERLVTSNLGFVVSIAKEYRNRGVAFEDLLNEGNVGLVEAARRFDPAHGTKFITYASWWVRKTILQALAEQPRLVRVSGYRLKRNRDSTDPVRTTTVSLDQPFDHDGRPLAERLVTDDPTAEDLVLREESVAQVRAALEQLSSQERLVVSLRFGLDGSPRLSLQEAGSRLALSRERIRQVECRALERLGRAVRNRQQARTTHRFRVGVRERTVA
ncbi:MAG TPA: sigma-70 family RNA polymerase sigma factor [Candidatus Polarisedimenticolaceae bacterium]